MRPQIAFWNCFNEVEPASNQSCQKLSIDGLQNEKLEGIEMIKQGMTDIADEKLFEQLEISGFGDLPTISTRYPQIRQTTDTFRLAPLSANQRGNAPESVTKLIFVA